MTVYNRATMAPNTRATAEQVNAETAKIKAAIDSLNAQIAAIIAGEGLPGYTWHAWADNLEGTLNFTTGEPGTRAYLGLAYDQSSNVPSTNPALYQWIRLRGIDSQVGELLAPTRAVMAAIPTPSVGTMVTLIEAGREGRFICRAGSVPGGDALQGLYVASTTAGYHWARMWDGIHGIPEWFGAKSGDDAFDCLAALQACVALCPVTLLKQDDYWISDTWVINTSWRKVVGRGYVTYNQYEGTRVILAHGSKTVIRVGPATDPGGNPGVTYLRQTFVQGVAAVRSVQPIPNATAANSPRAFVMQYAYKCGFIGCSGWESSIGFQFYGCVTCTNDDNFAFRSQAATTLVNDVFYGFHVQGDPALSGSGLVGGNASLYINRSQAVLSGNTGIVLSAGFRIEGAFADVFVIQPETLGARNGIWVTGTGPSGAGASNGNLHITQPVCDQPSYFGINIEGIAPTGMVEVLDPYCGMPGTAIASIYINTGGGLVTVTGGQAIAAPGSADPIGLYVKDCSGVTVDKLKITNHERPVYLDAATDFSINVEINGDSVTGVGTGAVVADDSVHGVINPKIIGAAGAFASGVNLNGSGNSIIEVNCTRINPACLTGGAANKLKHNGSQITAAGAFGTNCLAQGIMAA